MRSIRTAAIAAIVLSLSGTAATVEGASVSVIQTNLVTDNPAVNPAQITDAHLVNPWGVSFAPGGPFWVSDNQTGLSTLYSVDAAGAVTKVNLEVTIPGAPGGGSGTPTGEVFNAGNGAGAFNRNLFLFVNEDGTVSGWRGALGTTAEILATGMTANVYKGATEETVAGHTYLLAANFRAGTIDVFKGDTGAPNLTGNFLEPSLPAGYAPFNIQLLGGKLYVTYALQDSMKHDDAPGAGNGFVAAFDANGNFLGRVASGGNPSSPLNSPWGLAIAPSSFGSLAGDLLVGNFGDGKINAYNLATNSFDGQLTRPNGQPLVIDGLWALTVGGSGSDGNPQTVYFTAGPNDEMDGLFGALTAVPEPSSLVSGAIALLVGSFAYGRHRLRRAT
jgi:uncharacterized protein (TIGR03118 family)